MSFDEGWLKFFSEELTQEYFQILGGTVQIARNEGKKINPPDGMIFESFKLTPFSDLKVVIVGDEPYSQEGQDHGLAFSVPVGVPLTDELSNIYEELNRSLRAPKPIIGDLSKMASSGVLLLNNTLTVEVGAPGSHKNLGWNRFTANCLKYISDSKDERVVFCLWGREAQKHAPSIDKKKHLVLKSKGPSDRSFIGCNHFVHINQATGIWS